MSLCFVERYAVYPTESVVEVPYLSPLTLQFIAAFNSDGLNNEIDRVTDYRIEFSSNEDRVINYSRSDIEIISNRILQLTIPQANASHIGEYTFIAGNLYNSST